MPYGIENIIDFLPLVRALVLPIVAFIALNYLLNFFESKLLSKAKTKKQITNIEMFQKVAKVILIALILWIALLSYVGSFAGLGLSISVFAVIIGWTFMRPLLGVLAWFTIVVRRPFGIGDRIEISDVKGDVEDITFTHIYIRETGGLVRDSEDSAGSLVTIPNAFFFEHPVTNYTDRDHMVLQEVAFNVTYNSNIEKAAQIAVGAAEKVLSKELPENHKAPFVRTFFKGKGMAIHVRFYAPAKNVSLYVSTVTEMIFKEIKKAKGIHLLD